MLSTKLSTYKYLYPLTPVYWFRNKQIWRSDYSKLFWFQNERFCKLINNDACRNRYVHGVFGAQLRNFQTTVAGINNLLMNTFYLVS